MEAWASARLEVHRIEALDVPRGGSEYVPYLHGRVFNSTVRSHLQQTLLWEVLSAIPKVLRTTHTVAPHKNKG